MGDVFAEFCDFSTSEPLRQGDILEAIDINAAMWERHLMVITADCDLAFNKHHGRVTCIPLLTAEEYLLEMVVPRVRNRLVEKPVGELLKILDHVGGPRVSAERLRHWTAEESADSIIQALKLHEKNAVIARAAIESIQQFDASADELSQALRNLVDGQLGGDKPPTRKNAVARVLDPVREAYQRPPGDAMFISTFAASHDRGYFAYLRHLEQVWEPDVAIGPKHRDAKYKRISRLRDRYTHALVQRFATVFMAIGLPDEYEEARDVYFELMGDALK